MVPRIVLLFLFVVMPWLQPAVAQDTVVVKKMKDLDSIPVLDHAGIWEEKGGKVHWTEAINKPFFRKPNLPKYIWETYGRSRATLWVKLTVKNDMDTIVPMMLLFQRFAFYREAVAITDDDTIFRKPNYFFTSSTKEDRRQINKDVKPHQSITYLVRVTNPSNNLYTDNFMVTTSRAFLRARMMTYHSSYADYIAQIMFLAVVVFITLHTFAQYLIRRRREFIIYALYTSSVFLYFLNHLELARYYDIIFSYFPFIQKQASTPLNYLVYFFYFRFAREFVDFKALAPWFYKVIIWTERIVLLALVNDIIVDAVFNNYGLSQKMFIWLRIGLLAVSFTGIFLLLVSGKTVLYFFGIGTLLLIVGLTLAMIYMYFPNADPLWSKHHLRYMQIGVILELLCFTSGLSYKSHLIEVEKRNTQEQLIKQLEENRRLQDELNLKLEARVEEQTAKIVEQQSQLEREKEQQLTLEFTKKITEMELQLLKTQLNPHFYFNTLNNLYGLAMIAPKKAPDAILKLSDIMEYVIYDCRNDKVPLGKEIKFLQSYIELEKLRYDDNVRISISVTGQPDNRAISPMLLIQFVENGFKHGIEKEKSNSYLHINIHVHNGSLEYESVNSINGQTWKSGGVGLTNVRKRLDLLYPQKHDLQVVRGDHEFRVKLQLTL
jgi:sensor histidine kinase YesM